MQAGCAPAILAVGRWRQAGGHPGLQGDPATTCMNKVSGHCEGMKVGNTPDCGWIHTSQTNTRLGSFFLYLKQPYCESLYMLLPPQHFLQDSSLVVVVQSKGKKSSTILWKSAVSSSLFCLPLPDVCTAAFLGGRCGKLMTFYSHSLMALDCFFL